MTLDEPSPSASPMLFYDTDLVAVRLFVLNLDSHKMDLKHYGTMQSLKYDFDLSLKSKTYCGGWCSKNQLKMKII